MECPKCCQPLCCDTDKIIMCEGSCFLSYHIECVGIPETSMRCLSKNIIWLCDGCLATFYEQNKPMDSPKNEPSKFDLEIADVKVKIASIMETLSTITPQLSTTQQKDCSIQHTTHHSTPVSSPPLCSGSKLANGSSAELSLEFQQSVDETGFSLFLTNIDGSVTVQEVSRMAAESLGINETQRIEVVKLVPKWRTYHYQPNVSFRISMDKCFKHVALRPDTWPAGIMFREFIEQPRRRWIPFRQEGERR